MKLVFQCLQCGARNELTPAYQQHTAAMLLDIAYSDDEAFDTERRNGIVRYMPHQCQLGVLSVAQLIAVVE